MNENFGLLTWFFGLASAYFGIKWQSSSHENEHLKQKLSEKKEELYADFIKMYMEFVNSKTNLNDNITKMRNFNERILLVGSNKVLLTYGDLMQSLYVSDGKDLKTAMRLMGELIIAMREDLGHKDWFNSIYWFDTLKPWIKDIGNYIPERYKGLRRTYNKTLNPDV